MRWWFTIAVLLSAQVMDEGVMWREATTIDQRKKVLARFFKSVLSEVSRMTFGHAANGVLANDQSA